MLRKILRNKKGGEVIGDYRIRHNLEILDLYSSLNIVRVNKSSRLVREQQLWSRNLKERDRL